MLFFVILCLVIIWCVMTQVAAKGDVGELTKLCGESQGQDRLTIVDSRGWTALHHAAAHDHSQVIKLLLKHGAGQVRCQAECWTLESLIQNRRH